MRVLRAGLMIVHWAIRDSNSQFCCMLSAPPASLREALRAGICYAARASGEIDIFRLRTFDLVQP
jgi:hypothetical protein